jgi:hypothetical protein
VSFPRDAILTDLNRDGWDDLMVVTRTEVQIRYNSALPTGDRFSTVNYEMPLQDGQSAAVGDITGDGVPDIYLVQGYANGSNADDLILTGPSWSPLSVPPAESGTGDSAKFIDILGHQNVIVTNGRNYARGPVQFVSFQPIQPASTTLPAPVQPSNTSPPKVPRPLNPLPKATKVIRLPSNKRCLGRRGVRILIRRISGVALESATVFVNGKRVRVVRRNLHAPFSVGALQGRKFSVRVIVRTADGRNLSRSRRYHGCSARRR